MNWIDKYQITVYTGESDGEVILHSPLARKQKSVSASEFEAICHQETVPADMVDLTDYMPFDDRPHVETPEDYTLLTVLPNNRCNFTCSYCYSAGCRNSEELDFGKLKRCIDFFIESKRTRPRRRNLTISFMGGGEPMLSWHIVKRAVAYAEEKSDAEGVNMSFRVITNGSLIDDDTIAFIKSHNVGMSVSFEVLEDIQNLQRKNYERVDANLKRLLDEGVDTQLNITVTPHNVGHMEETYEAIRFRYPQVTHAMFEPVTAQDMFSSPDDMADFYSRYIRGFMQIHAQGKADGVEITSFPYLRTVFPLKRACPGEFCITAEGNLTGCYCVSMPNHPLFDITNYGSVDKDQVKIDPAKFNRLLGHNVNSKSECAQCSARWNCGGGCFHLFQTYSEEYRKVVCDFTRAFVHEIIKFKVNAKQDNR